MRSSFLTLVLFATPAAALDFGGILNWTGSGANRAALIVDFGDGLPATAWGYRFDDFNEADPATGRFRGIDMVRAVAAATTLDVEITSFSFGDAVTGFRDGTRSRGGFDPSSAGYFSDFVRDATTSEPTWTFADEAAVGASDRTLADGAWDAWSWYANFTSALPGPALPAPVPEPASLLVLAAGGAFLRRRRRG